MKRALAFTLMVLAIMIIAVSCEEPHVHSFTTEWTYDDTFHWHASTCGHEEVSEKGEHVWKEGGDDNGWITEKAATETEKGSAYRICTVCGYKGTKDIQKLSHVHTYSSYSSNSDKHWRTCTSCGEKFSYSHSLSYVCDANGHCQTCYCGYSTTKTAHTYKTEASASDGSTIQVCTVCKYQVTLTKKAETAVKVADISSIKEKDGTVKMTAEVSAEETTSASPKNETTVAFPDGALRVKEGATEVKLTVVAAPVSVASLNGSGYQITTEEKGATSEDADTSQAVVAGFEFKLEGAESSDLSGTTGKAGTTVTTYIAKGLTGEVTSGEVADETSLDKKIKIKYVGTNGGTAPEIVSYNNNSGKLVFRVYHFSKYIVISNQRKATDNKGNMYDTLSSAISDRNVGTEITLLADDGSLTGETEIERTVTLDLNGKKVTGNGKLKVSSGNVVTIMSEASKLINLITSGVKVGAADSDVGTYYPTLKEAIAKANENSPIVLLEIVEGLTTPIEISKSVSLNLNGKQIKSSTEVFTVKSGTLRIENGTIWSELNSNDTSKYVISVECSTGDAKLVLAENAKIEGKKCSGIRSKGTSNYTATLEISGSVSCLGTAVYQESHGSLTINSGASLTSMYGGNGSAVEIKGGTAVINGGVLSALASYTAYSSINSPAVGVAVAVSQNREGEPISVTLIGGTLNTPMGGKQIAILNPNNNSVDYTKNVKVIVSDKLKELCSTSIVGTKTDSSSGVDGTYYLNSASALAAGVKPVACIGETNYASLEDAISEAKSEATIELKKSVSGVTLTEVNRNLTIKLNENTLAFASGTCIDVSAKLSFEGDANKKSKITSSQNSLFAVKTNGELSLDEVTVEVESTENANAIAYVYQGTNPGKITIESSDLTMRGTYGIGTNAGSGGSGPSKNVKITIKNSCVTATRNNGDSTGLLVNVSSTVTIENSTISGDRQGAIFRGVGAGSEQTSAVTIIESTVEATGKNTESDSIGEGDWGDGNEVPKAALVVGNKNGNYSQPTTVSLKNVKLSVANPDVWKNIWVYQESNEDYVKVSGDIESTWTVNSDRNRADYPTAKIGETTYFTLQSAIDAASDTENTDIYLLCDTTGSGIGTKDGVTQCNITIDFGGHTYKMIDPAVGSVDTENQAMHWATTTSSVTLKNGIFVVASGVKSTHMGMQSHTTFTAEDMVFDFGNVVLEHYNRTDKWSTFEKPIFNNNKGKTMTLKNCSITMPSSSTKGISANDSETDGTKEYGGELILDNTKVIGYVNLQSTVGKLTVKGENKINEKQVVSYFAGYTVDRAESNGVDTYTLKLNET